MNATLLSAWSRTVRAAPNAPALIEAGSGRAWTRAELDSLAGDWRPPEPLAPASLHRRTVVLAQPNGPRWLIALLALLKADAVIAPLDPGEPLATQRTTAGAIGASFLWSTDNFEALPTLRRPHRDARRLVKLTSGSTGTPRALAFTDAQMLADGRQVCASMKIAPADINFALIPFGHSYGLGNLIVPLLTQGTAIACGSAAFPHAIATEIARTRAAVFPAVPALLRALADADVPRIAFRRVRTVISAGAPLAPDTARRFHEKFGLNIHSFYGATETGGITYDRTGTAARTGRGVGRPLRGVTLTFDRRGRFRVASAAVFTLGNRQHHSHKNFGEHPPADFGSLNPRGELVLAGRAGRTVKIAGRRLNLAEIEHALRQLPGVRDAFAAPHPERTDALAAAIVSSRTPDDLRAELRTRLPSWKIPRKLVTLPEFPLTPRGKIDTRRLQQLLTS